MANSTDSRTLSQRYIDLHLHSTASDGAYRPARLVEMAHARDLSAIALTDHDTTAGLAEAAERAPQLGIEFVPGIELEAFHPRGVMHILGYFIDAECPALETFAGQARVRRAERNRAILEKLEPQGIRIGPLEFEGREIDTIGRPHIADALVRLGHARSFRAAFDDYLGEKGAAYVALQLPRAEDAIAAIRSAGGFASLAHPVRLRAESLLELKTTLKRLRAAGLGGLEVWHPSHSAAQVRDYAEMCVAMELCPTGGSDFHRLPPSAQRGVGFGSRRLPYEILEWMRVAWKRTLGPDGATVKREKAALSQAAAVR